MSEATESKALQRLVTDLCATHGENLESITLYGSNAAGKQTDAHSDHNVLVVLRRIELDDLRRSQKPTRAWKDAGQPPPVFFTVDELKRAADVFPIEFLQMEKARKTLYGSDPFEFVEISRANLRHQTEYELRTKFIQLRRLYISESHSVANLSALMIDSFASFAALFRAVLILHGHESPVSNADAVRRAVSLLGLDGKPFEWILERRARKTSSLIESEVNNIFAAYLVQIERVIDAVDRIEHT